LKGDIVNSTKLLTYPQVNPSDYDNNGYIKDSKILKIIEDHQEFINKFNTNLDFYIGKNKRITQQIDTTAPDNEINIPYARTLTHTIKGYMFKPETIIYSIEDEENQEYFDNLMEIYKINKEPLKNSELGEDQSKYGIAFEILYAKLNGDTTIPYFVVVKPQEIIPIYDYTIEKNIVACIRYYDIETDDTKTKQKVEVYYTDRIINYYLKVTEIKNNELLTTLELIGETENMFQDIPINIYCNNQEYMADYEPIQALIQLLDKLMSDSANELDRFAAAYLVMKEYILGGNVEESENKLERLKKLRIFEIGKDGDIQFLTKDIPVAFFQEIKNTIKEDIQKHSFIPDFMDQSFGTASGIAIRYKLIGLENLCADKEALFRVGLERRIQLINNFLKIQKYTIDISNINIKFYRNLPESLTEEITNFKIVDPDGGMLSKKTALSLLSFIKNSQEEIDKINEDMETRKANQPEVDLDNLPEETNDMINSQAENNQVENLKQQPSNEVE